MHTRFYNTHFLNYLWYFWPFRHLIRVIMRHDMTNQKTLTMTKTKSTLDICGKDHWPLKQDHLENTSKRQAQWQKTSKTFLRVVFCVLYTFKPIKDWTRNKKPRVLIEIDNRFCSDLFPKIKLPLLPVSPHAGFFSLPAFRSHQHYRTNIVDVRHGWQRSWLCWCNLQ